MTLTDHGQLLPAPRGPQGGALRCQPANWADVMAAPHRHVERLLAASGSPSGPVREREGVAMVPVTFAAEAPGDRAVLAHLSGYTDRHRTDYRPSPLQQLPGTEVAVGTFLLPADGVLTYRLTDVTGLPHDVGTQRAGWREVHRRGRPDPANPHVLPTPLGGDASVWVGPQAPFGSWPSTEVPGWQTRMVSGRAIRVLPGDNRVVVLFDGQFWEPLACGAGVRAAGHGHTLVQVPCPSIEAREADLTQPDAATALVRAGLVAAGEVLGREVAVADVVAGQSYGGLAVAGVAHAHPELLRAGVVQSGSFWYPDGDDRHSGALLTAVAAGVGAVSTPVIVQVGSEEDDMVLHARRYRDALRTRGADVGYREVRGGNDYAWWRHGLVAALDELSGVRATAHQVQDLTTSVMRAQATG